VAEPRGVPYNPALPHTAGAVAGANAGAGRNVNQDVSRRTDYPRAKRVLRATPEGEFIAGSIDEITKLVAVAVAALELDR